MRDVRNTYTYWISRDLVEPWDNWRQYLGTQKQSHFKWWQDFELKLGGWPNIRCFNLECLTYPMVQLWSEFRRNCPWNYEFSCSETGLRNELLSKGLGSGRGLGWESQLPGTHVILNTVLCCRELSAGDSQLPVLLLWATFWAQQRR